MENIKTVEMQNVTANLEAALKNLQEYSRYTPEDVDRLEHAAWDALELLKEQDAVEPVRRGKWIKQYAPEGHVVPYKSYKCSICGQYDDDGEEHSYCPHCGARMEREVE